MNTKERIIIQGIKSFNKSGYGTVSLFELAKDLGMSRGNITYHFKDKEILLRAIINDMWHKIEENQAHSRQFPSFENLHKQIQVYYKFQKAYSFIFQDIQILKHPYVQSKLRKMAAQYIKDAKAIIAFSIEIGNMYPEKIPGLYHNLSVSTWTLAFFWSTQQTVRGRKSNEDGEKIIWSLILPHFTEKGLTSFKKFFGTKYMMNLGQAFDENIDSYISF